MSLFDITDGILLSKFSKYTKHKSLSAEMTPLRTSFNASNISLKLKVVTKIHTPLNHNSINVLVLHKMHRWVGGTGME